MVNFTRRSPYTGNVNTLTFNISQVEFDEAYANWQAGDMIQTAFEMLDAGEREFIKTGITPQEWVELFGEDD